LGPFNADLWVLPRDFFFYTWIVEPSLRINDLGIVFVGEEAVSTVVWDIDLSGLIAG